MDSILKLNVRLMAEVEKLKDEQYHLTSQNDGLKSEVSRLEDKIESLQSLKCLKVRSRLFKDISNIETRLKEFEKYEEETYEDAKPKRKRVRRVAREEINV